MRPLIGMSRYALFEVGAGGQLRILLGEIMWPMRKLRDLGARGRALLFALVLAVFFFGWSF